MDPSFLLQINKLFTNRRDILAPEIEADMFYIPYKVNSVGTQLEKYWWTILFYNIPLFNPVVVLTTYTCWFFDYFNNILTGAEVFIYPSTYNNALAQSAIDPEYVGEPWGPFRYFDLFSISGVSDYQYMYDNLVFSLRNFPIGSFELFFFIARAISDDWDLLNIEVMRPVNRNSGW